MTIRNLFFGAMTVALALALSTEGMAANFQWYASEVKEITVTPNPAPALQPATIKCTWEGVGPLTFLEQSEAWKYLHKGMKPVVPGYIRVMGTDIQVLYVGGLPVGQMESREVKWSPLTSSIGKTVTVECVLDPEKKVHYSSKTIEVPVVAKQETSTPVAGAGLPDITSDPAVTVGTQAAQWGGIVAVNAAEARRMHDGVCDFIIRHTAHNNGASATGPFGRRWTNSNVPGNWDMSYPSIPANGTLERVDTLPLKPGRNVLYLTLDSDNAVAETNENNNLFRVAVDVSGACEPASAPAAPGGRLKWQKP